MRRIATLAISRNTKKTRTAVMLMLTMSQKYRRVDIYGRKIGKRGNSSKVRKERRRSMARSGIVFVVGKIAMYTPEIPTNKEMRKSTIKGGVSFSLYERRKTHEVIPSNKSRSDI
jgi:hypothetical protein